MHYKRDVQQLELTFGSLGHSAQADAGEWLRLGSRCIRLFLVRHRRARRYVLRLRDDDVARVTIPRGGSAAEARRFAEKHVAWLEKQLLGRAAAPRVSRAWRLGSTLLFRGEEVRIGPGDNGETNAVRFGELTIAVENPYGDLRPEVECSLWRLAARELPQRVLELAGLHQLPVRRVSVRNQKSRWGSCSRRGMICLNWRLVQAPEFVRDYIILHELAHLKEMNHSGRFWAEVGRMCPEYPRAESWLKENRGLLR